MVRAVALRIEATGRGGQEGAPQYQTAEMVQRMEPWEGIWLSLGYM